jgi:hypothetical protein
VAFAAQLGRIAGRAAHLLEELAGRGIKPSRKKGVATAARGRNKGRSGGVVDAPGKKHRKPAPRDPDARMANSQTAKMRDAKTMVKTNRRRGRG